MSPPCILEPRHSDSSPASILKSSPPTQGHSPQPQTKYQGACTNMYVMLVATTSQSCMAIVCNHAISEATVCILHAVFPLYLSTFQPFRPARRSSISSRICSWSGLTRIWLTFLCNGSACDVLAARPEAALAFDATWLKCTPVWH